MKRVLLFIILISSCGFSFAQKGIFMHILENKMICNKEDELTYFLQAHSYDRQNENHYYHRYAEGGQFYYSLLINDNDCYVIYRTDNAKDYNKIKAEITGTWPKELAADNSVSYVLNNKRVRDVQIIFPGYSQKDKFYEILVYQNPEQHELPYNQANRIMPDADKPVVTKKVKKQARKQVAHSTEVKAESAKTVTPAPVKTSAVPAPVTKPNPTPKTTTPPSVTKPMAPAPKVALPAAATKAAPVKATMSAAPSVIKK